MATISYDRREWRKHWSDTLFNAVCVKSNHPEMCGRLCKPEISFEKARKLSDGYDGEWIVIGHGWDDTDAEKFVWRGSDAEFRAIWTID